MKKIMFLSGLFFLLAMRPAHPLKMCVCQVKHQPESGRLHLSFRFFRDDLESALEQQSGRALDLTKITPENNRLLADFITEQFHLQINRQPMTLRHLQSSLDDIVLVVEFVAPNFTPAGVYDVELENRILLDVYPDQYNMVRFDFFGDGNLETMRFEQAERRLSKRIARHK